MSLNGTLSTMALPDLLQWLATAAKSGCLRITNGRFKKQIFFEEGIIISCSSDDPREFLGQFLLSNHKISEDQLRQAMETQRSTGIMLGKILVMVGAVSEESLGEMLKRKAEESLFALFLWKEASFDFDEREIDVENLMPLSLKVEDVLLEGLKRYDELQVILKAFSSSDFVLARTDNPIPDELAQRQDVQDLLALVDGKRNLTDICLELRLSEFKVSSVVYCLHKIGGLAVGEPRNGDGDQASGPSVADVEVKADKLIADKKYEAALDLLGQAVEGCAYDLQLKSKLEEVEADGERSSPAI